MRFLHVSLLQRQPPALLQALFQGELQQQQLRCLFSDKERRQLLGVRAADYISKRGIQTLQQRSAGVRGESRPAAAADKASAVGAASACRSVCSAAAALATDATKAAAAGALSRRIYKLSLKAAAAGGERRQGVSTPRAPAAAAGASHVSPLFDSERFWPAFFGLHVHLSSADLLELLRVVPDLFGGDVGPRCFCCCIFFEPPNLRQLFSYLHVQALLVQQHCEGRLLHLVSRARIALLRRSQQLQQELPQDPQLTSASLSITAVAANQVYGQPRNDNANTFKQQRQLLLQEKQQQHHKQRQLQEEQQQQEEPTQEEEQQQQEVERQQEEITQEKEKQQQEVQRQQHGGQQQLGIQQPSIFQRSSLERNRAFEAYPQHHCLVEEGLQQHNLSEEPSLATKEEMIEQHSCLQQEHRQQQQQQQQYEHHDKQKPQKRHRENTTSHKKGTATETPQHVQLEERHPSLPTKNPPAAEAFFLLNTKQQQLEQLQQQQLEQLEQQQLEQQQQQPLEKQQQRPREKPESIDTTQRMERCGGKVGGATHKLVAQHLQLLETDKREHQHFEERNQQQQGEDVHHPDRHEELQLRQHAVHERGTLLGDAHKLEQECSTFWSSLMESGLQQQHQQQQQAAVHALAGADRHSKIQQVTVALFPLVPLDSHFFLLSSVSQQAQLDTAANTEDMLLQQLLVTSDSAQLKKQMQQQQATVAHAVLFLKKLLGVQRTALLYQRDSELCRNLACQLAFVCCPDSAVSAAVAACPFSPAAAEGHAVADVLAECSGAAAVEGSEMAAATAAAAAAAAAANIFGAMASHDGIDCSGCFNVSGSRSNRNARGMEAFSAVAAASGVTVLFMERQLDCVTPLLVPWRYEGLLHEFLGICQRRVDVPCSKPGDSNSQAQQGQQKDREELFLGDNSDLFYRHHRDRDFPEVVEALNVELRSFKASLSCDCVEEAGKLFAQLPAQYTRKKTLAKHLACLEFIDKAIVARQLLQLLPLEQWLLQEHLQAQKQQQQGASTWQHVLKHLESFPSASPFDVLRLTVAAALIHTCGEIRIKALELQLRIRLRKAGASPRFAAEGARFAVACCRLQQRRQRSLQQKALQQQLQQETGTATVAGLVVDSRNYEQNHAVKETIGTAVPTGSAVAAAAFPLQPSSFLQGSQELGRTELYTRPAAAAEACHLWPSPDPLKHGASAAGPAETFQDATSMGIPQQLEAEGEKGIAMGSKRSCSTTADNYSRDRWPSTCPASTQAACRGGAAMDICITLDASSAPQHPFLQSFCETSWTEGKQQQHQNQQCHQLVRSGPAENHDSFVKQAAGAAVPLTSVLASFTSHLAKPEVALLRPPVVVEVENLLKGDNDLFGPFEEIFCGSGARIRPAPIPKGGVVVVFLLGGATLEERYWLQQLGKSTGREILLGTDNCLNITEMMRYLNSVAAGN